jgi:Rrf2 family protein
MSRPVYISGAASPAIYSLALIASVIVRPDTKQIADILQVSQNHLSKILQALDKNEYLESIQGSGGGFTFAKNASEISILEIYQLIEGNVDCQFCGIAENTFPFINFIFGGKPYKLTNEFVENLTNTKMSELKTKEINYA